MSGSSKRRTQSGRSGAISSEQDPSRLVAFRVCHSPLKLFRPNGRCQCTRCADAGDKCSVDPAGGACGQCRQKKAKCSLVPRNAETGKADRHRYTQSEVLEMRLNLLEADDAPASGEQGAVTRAAKRSAAGATEKQGAATAKGKAAAKGKQPAAPPKRAKRTRSSSETDELEASGPAPSPSTSLAALENLALESGGSSAANTAADSPATRATLPKLRLPKRPSPTSLTAPQGSHSSRSSGSKSFYQLLYQLPLRIQQALWLRCRLHRKSFSSPAGVGMRLILQPTHHQRATVETSLPGLPRWRGR